MAENLPYVTSVGTLEKMLEKIKTASIPERFTQDFVKTVLGMPGGTPQAVMPFLKKMGFVSSGGHPTDLYREFKNPKKSGTALAKAFKKLYSRLYEKNEYIEAANDDEIKGLIIECTGAEENAQTVKLTLWTINTLRKIADFSGILTSDDSTETEVEQPNKVENNYTHHLPQLNIPQIASKGINLSYTINLNLPATKDIEVFNAIFKSLKKHLIEG